MKVMILDAGNSQVKAKTATSEICFPSIFSEISESKYNETMALYSSNPPSEYIALIINDEPRYFAIGDKASQHGPTPQSRGADKYRKDYYRIFAAAALAQMYKAGGEVALFLSYPPGDVRYRDDMSAATTGVYDMKVGNKEIAYNVPFTDEFDEPSGGLMNVLLTEDGTGYKKPALAQQRVLVVDIGGGTTDFIQLNENQTVDYGSAHSESTGVIDAMLDFERDLKAAHKAAFKSAYRLPQDRVIQAIRTGVWRGGGQELDCSIEADNAKNRIGTKILQVIQSRYGGGMMFDSILFTGGGSALLFEHLADQIGNKDVHLADDIDSLHMANVRGGMKIWKLLQAIEQ